MSDRQYCIGCRDDYYNGQGAKECWGRKTAKVVKRFRIGWWTEPDKPGAFTEVKTHQCHHAPGKYSDRDMLPNFAVEPTRLKR